jgi:M6 family metalloprotease-like protein
MTPYITARLRSYARFAGMLLASTIALSGLAQAVVQPPEQWFDEDPSNAAIWQEMGPILNDWEFRLQAPTGGPGTDSYDVIERNLGRGVDELAAEAGEPTAGVSHDLNRDGVLDHFDVLELGYEVRTDRKGTSIAPPTGTNQILMLRADFQDQNANYSNYDIDHFNERFFDHDVTPRQSFRDYFHQVSYGLMEVEGIVSTSGAGGDGWHKGQQTKQWYIDNGGRWLVQEAVLAADDEINYADFDVDGDGYVDCVMLFYPNAVFSGGLWPHRSSGLNIHVDGVIVDSYFISGYNTGADSWTMEISAHEYGHILGLPDLYDVGGATSPNTGSSNGMGRWSLMAYQYDGTHRPPSPDPWCKCQLGWTKPDNIIEDVTGLELPDFQNNPVVKRVWTNGQTESQYFLLANYRQVLTDATRPGQGLMILHIDDTRAGNNSDNSNEFRKHVDVVSARGWVSGAGTSLALDGLDKTSNGHANDLWRAATKDECSDTTDCNLRKYENSGDPSATDVRIYSISAPGATMTVDIDLITATAPTISIDAPAPDANVSGNVQIDVTATASGGRTISRVEFFCNGAYLGQDTTSPYSLTFNSRGIYDGTRAIRAVAVDSAGESRTAQVSVELSNTATSVPFSEGFELATGGIGAWAVYDLGGNSSTGVNRRWANSTNRAATGSRSAFVGATSGGYGFSEHDELVSPLLDLAGLPSAIVRFKQRHRVSNGENTCKVFVTDDEGLTFELLGSYSGTSAGWTANSSSAWIARGLSLNDYAGQQVRVVFRFDSSALSRIGSGEAGWWVDDVVIEEISLPPSVVSITPGDGSTVSGDTLIEVEADDDYGITAVEFRVNNADLIHTDFSPPFSFNWPSGWVFDGPLDFTAVVFDDDFQSDSLTVSWTAENAGLTMPWFEDFTDPLHSNWRIIDPSGAGSWQRLPTAGHNSTPGMYFGISGLYDDNESDSLISPTLALGSLAAPSVSFLHRHDIEATWDFARLFVTTNLGTWTQLGSWSAYNQPWQWHGSRLDAYAGQPIKLRWFFESDVLIVEEGWWVDDAGVHSAPLISSVNPERIPRGDTPEVTVSGSGFGDASLLEQASLTLDGTPLTTTTWGDTQITFDLPGGATSGELVVTRRMLSSDPYWLQVILPPGSLDGVEQR